MNKENFDIYWKIALVIILIIAIIFMFKQFSQLNEEGIDCRTNPFVWGANEFSKKYDNDPVYCNCIIGDNKTFRFDENSFNPKFNFNSTKYKELWNIV